MRKSLVSMCVCVYACVFVCVCTCVWLVRNEAKDVRTSSKACEALSQNCLESWGAEADRCLGPRWLFSFPPFFSPASLPTGLVKTKLRFVHYEINYK